MKNMKDNVKSSHINILGIISYSHSLSLAAAQLHGLEETLVAMLFVCY